MILLNAFFHFFRFGFYLYNLINSKGKNIELYLAEEAIGLGKSMEWEIVPGPFDKKENLEDGMIQL